MPAPISFWQRALRRPQQLWLRRALFQIHLWTGLIVGLYIIAIGVSGSILVYKEELLPRPAVSVPSVDLRACSPQLLVSVVERVQRAYPHKIAYLTACPQEAVPFFMTTVRDPGPARPPTGVVAVFSHPSSGLILGHADRENSFIHWLEHLHVDLLLGRSGRLWNGIGAATLLALLLSGLVLWWPGIRAWRRGFTLNFNLNWKRINWDLHNVSGFYTLAFTLIWALTGLYFTWPKLFTTPIAHFSPIRNANFPAAKMRALARRPPPPPNARLNVPAVLAHAQSLSPSGSLEGYFYGSGPNPIFTVYMARARVGDYASTDFLYFDQRSGQHLHTWRRGQNHSLGDSLIWLIAPLHFGTSWGPAFKALWFTLGLSLPLLTITGFIMYWNRYLSRKLRPAPFGSTIGAAPTPVQEDPPHVRASLPHR